MTNDKNCISLVFRQTSGLLQLTVRMASETEFTCVERITHYADTLEQEAPEHIKDADPAESWPDQGVVQFDRYQMRYRESLPLVLKDVQCNIRPRESVGIVGRTGSGDRLRIGWKRPRRASVECLLPVIHATLILSVGTSTWRLILVPPDVDPPVRTASMASCQAWTSHDAGYSRDGFYANPATFSLSPRFTKLMEYEGMVTWPDISLNKSLARCQSIVTKFRSGGALARFPGHHLYASPYDVQTKRNDPLQGQTKRSKAKGRRPKTVPPSPLLLLIAFMEDDRKLSYCHPLLSVVAMKDDRTLSYRLSSSCRL
ncbi:Multidrug resistance-associated protein 5 [Branchiostoma belcheri]|nr:Multidrug resistance-associated protein 5 [Branchiostoma belcheri]